MPRVPKSIEVEVQPVVKPLAEVKAEIEAQPGIRTTRTLGQSMVGGTGVAGLIAFVYEKVFHEPLDTQVAITLAGLLTGLAAYVQNALERGRKLRALRS